VRELAAAGEDVDPRLSRTYQDLFPLFQGATPVMMAMTNGKWNCVEALLAAGASAHRVSDNGFQPLGYAVMGEAAETVRGWLRRFPEQDLECPERLLGATPLQGAAFACSRAAPIVELLLEAKASAAGVAGNGFTALHFATMKEDSDPDVVRLLAKHGCDPSARQRPTMLRWKAAMAALRAAAAVSSNTLVAEFAEWHQTTALHLAARRGDAASAEALIDGRADPSVLDGHGHSAVQAAFNATDGSASHALVALLSGGRPTSHMALPAVAKIGSGATAKTSAESPIKASSDRSAATVLDAAAADLTEAKLEA